MSREFDPNDFLDDENIDYETMDEYPPDSWEPDFNKKKVNLGEFHEGMQKMVAKMVTTYLLSKEAEEAGVVGFEIMKVDGRYEGEFSVKSSFIVDSRKIKNRKIYEEVTDEPEEDTNITPINDPDLPEFVKEMLLGGLRQNNNRIVGIDVNEFMKQVGKKEADKDEKPKRKRGRPKKDE